MRFYLPVTSSELTQPQLPTRSPLTCDPQAQMKNDEDVYEEAYAQAEFEALELVVETAGAGNAKARIILCGETTGSTVSWNDVESIMVDDAQLSSQIEDVINAVDQDEMDIAVERVLSEPLEWFDKEELEKLRQRFRS